MRPNGNTVYTYMSGAAEISQDSKIVWNYKAPPGTEIHSAQPLKNSRVPIMRNGNPAQAMIVNTTTGEIEKVIPIPTTMAKTHGQFRHIRLTAGGTLLVPHMSEGKVVEYDLNAGDHNTTKWAGTVQVLEVNPGQVTRVGTRGMENPDRGPATSMQLLDEPGRPETFGSTTASF